jgi:hypothetical protein
MAPGKEGQRQAHAEGKAGPHGPHNIDGNLVDNSAVPQAHSLNPDRPEEPGHRAAGLDGAADVGIIRDDQRFAPGSVIRRSWEKTLQDPAPDASRHPPGSEDHPAVMLQIRGNHCQVHLQLVESPVADQAVDRFRQHGVGDQPAAVSLPGRPQRVGGTDHVAKPVELPGCRFDPLLRNVGGIEGRDDRPGGSSGRYRGQPAGVTPEGSQHSDVRQSSGSPSPQGKADAFTSRR